MTNESTVRATRRIRSIQPRVCRSSRPADRARDRFRRLVGKPPFLADWTDAIFLHFAIPVAELQPYVTYELDLRAGTAFVSLVAFRMERFRVPALRRLGAWPWKPLANQHFLNVRTYVRQGDETGILFLAEFLSNRLCAAFGPMTYGLPSMHARIHCERRGCRFHATVRKGNAEFRCAADPVGKFHPSAAGSLDEWLMERHTAFTVRFASKRLFRIWHEPWPQSPARIHELDLTLLSKSMPWWPHARFIGANCTPGVCDVWMGLPMPVTHEESPS
jgi:uncharacterized protein